MARILITGGTGLIGTRLVARAIDAGHEPVLLCRREPPSAVDWIEADLSQPGDLFQRLPREPFDAVVHLAQAAEHNDFPANAASAVALNLAAPLALCQWAVQTGCPQFIYASSGGICGAGNDPGARISEDWPRRSAPELSFYLSTKARCEELLASFAPLIRLDVLRYFFVYGSGQRANFLFPRLAQKLREGQPIELAGGHGPWLNPIHADDAAGLTLAAVGSCGGPVTNIAGVEDTTLERIVRAMAAALGTEAVIRSVDGVPPIYLADVDRMKQRLGIPRIGLAEGIRMTLAGSEA